MQLRTNCNPLSDFKKVDLIYFFDSMKSFDLLNNHGELDKGSVDFFNEKSVRETEKNGYSVLHIITQVLFWAENQSNHQN